MVKLLNKPRFRYVDFSRKTAKKNPGMVIREYERLIGEITYELPSFLDTPLSLEFYATKVLSRWQSWPSQVVAEADFKELMMLYEKVIEKEAKNIAKYRELEDIKEEFERFKNKYRRK